MHITPTHQITLWSSVNLGRTALRRNLLSSLLPSSRVSRPPSSVPHLAMAKSTLPPALSPRVGYVLARQDIERSTGLCFAADLFCEDLAFLCWHMQKLRRVQFSISYQYAASTPGVCEVTVYVVHGDRCQRFPPQSHSCS